MVATTAALIGMAIASAGSKAVESGIQAHQAGKAVKAQQSSIQQALNLQQQMWGQQQQYQKPYLDAGNNAVGLLGSLMRPAGSPGAYNPTMPTQQPQNQFPGMNPMGPRMWGQ